MSLINPARKGQAVTPSDTTELNLTSALWVGTAGNLTVEMENGDTLTIPNASGWMPIRVTRVLAATAASGIVAFWSD